MHRRVATSEGCTFFRKGTKCAGQALTIPTDMPHVLLAALAIGNECQRMHRPRRLFPNGVSLAAYAYPMYEKKSSSRGISRNLGRTKSPKSVNPRVRCIFLLKKKRKRSSPFRSYRCFDITRCIITVNNIHLFYYFVLRDTPISLNATINQTSLQLVLARTPESFITRKVRFEQPLTAYL